MQGATCIIQSSIADFSKELGVEPEILKSCWRCSIQLCVYIDINWYLCIIFFVYISYIMLRTYIYIHVVLFKRYSHIHLCLHDIKFPAVRSHIRFQTFMLWLCNGCVCCSIKIPGNDKKMRALLGCVYKQKNVCISFKWRHVFETFKAFVFSQTRNPQRRFRVMDEDGLESRTVDFNRWGRKSGVESRQP